MNQSITGDLPDVARKAGQTLPAPYYLAEDSFALDMDLLFGRHWICVGVEADVPQNGDRVVLEIGACSVIIVRSRDGVIRALANVCLHRGSRVCDSGKGHGSRLVCPYHQWTYGLDGQLLFARHMGKDFATEGIGLRNLPLRTIGGLLFLCLADDPPDDFDDMAHAVEPLLEPFDLAHAKIAHEEDLIEDGNWKLTIENNRECYHCEGSHPELGASFIAADFFDYPPGESPFKEPVGREAQLAHWESLGLVNGPVERMHGCSTPFRAERLVIAGAGESQTLSTEVASARPLGRIDERRLGDVHFWTFSSWHHFMGDHAVSIFVVPLSPGKTLVRTKWLVAANAVEGVDYDRENLVAVWRATNKQDAALVARTHAGVADPNFRPGPYSQHAEKYVNFFVTWYLERLQALGQ